jgi:hypothetical protein
MCKRLFLLVLFALVLAVVCPVRGATIFHWKFDGTEGQEIISDVDIVGGKVATKFYDEGYDPNEQDFSLTYGEANPWWGVTGTSADFVREPGDNDPGVGFFVPDDADTDLSSLSECTIEAFVYPREVFQSVIVRKYQGTGVYYIDTRPEENSYHTGKGVFAIRMANATYDTGDQNSVCHDVPYTPEEWHHVALVWTGTVMKFYVNAVQAQDIGIRVGDGHVEGTGVSEVPFEGPIGNSSAALGIGCIVRGAMTDPCAPPSTGQFFHGKIDELIFSDVALPPEQLRINWPEPHASQPNPKSGTENACPGDELCWKAGAFADQHDVYLGTDYDDVKNASSIVTLGVYKGRQGPNCYTPSLDLGQTYYWRIDAVNDACSPFLWKGAVWEFTTNDGAAYNPDPQDEQTVVPLEPVLSWSPGCEATSHKVYFSTDVNDVNERQAAAFLDEIDPNTIDPCDSELQYFTWYYWAVDETDGVSTWPGAVWSFRTQSAIIDVNMTAHYTLDEESGGIASDSSGYENHANVGGGSDWDPNDGRWDGSLGFDDDTDLECPTGLMSKISEGITVSIWLKDADRPGSNNWVFEVPGGSGSTVQAAVVEDSSKDAYWRAGNDSNDVIRWDLDGQAAGAIDGWHHWAFVKNEVSGLIAIYFDGFVVESNDVVDNTIINVRNREMRFGVGSGHSNDFIGRMDDIKVFDKGLSAQQVAALFRGGELGVAWAPDPGDNAKDVPRDKVLSWQPGNWVEKHDVYLGTDWDDVNDATTDSVGIYKGRQDPCEYNPGGLALNTTHYWRIDEVNTVDPNLWKGNVWTFTVANFLIIDNFEVYDTVTNKIFNTWEDGNVNLTGSFVDLGVEPFSPVHIGIKSMLYVYDNTIKWDWDHYWSEAKLPFSPAKDFTEADVKVLTLYFHGSADNDANDTEELYVGLEGSLAEVRYSDDHGNDNNDIRLEEWTEWNIPISEFSGVDPCAVTGLLIGFGDRDNTDKVGGEGVVYFDDVRLNRPRCLPELLKPAVDLNNDCIVSWGDIDVIGSQWLRSDANVNPVLDPTTVDLVGHWELEGDADDSSGNNYHGTAEGAYDWISGKIGSGAIDLSGGWVVVEDEGNTPKLRPMDEVSVTTWIRLDTSPDSSTRVVIKGRDDHETYATEVGDDGVLVFFVRDPNGVRYPVESDDGLALNEWIHVAGTYDDNELIAYVNGQVEGTDTIGAVALLADANDGLGIGGRYGDTNLRFPGGFDDVRVYDRALSRAEVAWLASQGTGEVLLDSAANLYSGESPEVINIRDVAVLLETWLEERLWPE